MAPPIKYGLGYRSRTRTLTLTLTLKVTIMYAVQNDTKIKFNIVLYVQVIFLGQGIQKAHIAKRKSNLPSNQSLSRHANHLRYDD